MCVVYMVYNDKNRENEVRRDGQDVSASSLRGMAIAMNGFASEELHLIPPTHEEESYDQLRTWIANLSTELRATLDNRTRSYFKLPKEITSENQAVETLDLLQHQISMVLDARAQMNEAIGKIIASDEDGNTQFILSLKQSETHANRFSAELVSVKAHLTQIDAKLDALLSKLRATLKMVAEINKQGFAPEDMSDFVNPFEKTPRVPKKRVTVALDNIRNYFRQHGKLRNFAYSAAGVPFIMAPEQAASASNIVQEVIAKEVCADPAVSAEVAMALENVNKVFGSEIDVDVLFNWCEQQVGDMGLHTMRANHEKELQDSPELGGYADLFLLQERTISADSVDYQNIEKATPPEIWNDTENNTQYLLHYYLDAYQEGDQIIISGIPAFEDENLKNDATAIVNSVGKHIVEGRLALEDISKQSIAVAVDRTNPNKPTITLVWAVGTEFSFNHSGANQLMTPGSIIAFDANGGDHFVSTVETTGPFRNSKAEVRDVRDLRAVLPAEIADQLPTSGKTLVLTSENNVLLKIITSDTAISLVEPQLINSKSNQAINIRITPEVGDAAPIGKIQPDQAVKVVPASTFEAIQGTLPAGFTIERNTDLNFIFARTADNSDFWVLIEFTNEAGETVQGWALNSLLEFQLFAPEAAPAPAINEGAATPEPASAPAEGVPGDTETGVSGPTWDMANFTGDTDPRALDAARRILAQQYNGGAPLTAEQEKLVAGADFFPNAAISYIGATQMLRVAGLVEEGKYPVTEIGPYGNVELLRLLNSNFTQIVEGLKGPTEIFTGQGETGVETIQLDVNNAPLMLFDFVDADKIDQIVTRFAPADDPGDRTFLGRSFTSVSAGDVNFEVLTMMQDGILHFMIGLPYAGETVTPSNSWNNSILAIKAAFTAFTGQEMSNEQYKIVVPDDAIVRGDIPAFISDSDIDFAKDQMNVTIPPMATD